jgi:hypothetical protein
MSQFENSEQGNMFDKQFPRMCDVTISLQKIILLSDCNIMNQVSVPPPPPKKDKRKVKTYI